MIKAAVADAGTGLELITKVDAILTALEAGGEVSAADLAEDHR